MVKRILAIFVVIVMFLALAAGCTSPSKKPTLPSQPQKTTTKIINQTSAVQYPPVPPPVPADVGTDFERKVVELVNIERQKVGHEPLVEDKLLDQGATAKAEDMRDKNYFGHKSPTYGSPFEMMKTFGVQYQTAGENIASGYKTPEEVVSGWMNSPGHRANILNTKFGMIGVGYGKGGKSGVYWVQWFTNSK